MKKFLVFALVLVMALAGSVFAADDAVEEEVVEPIVPVLVFGGEFGAKIEHDVLTWAKGDISWSEESESTAFKVLDGRFAFSQTIKLNMKSNSDTWSLNVNFANRTDGVDAFASLDGRAGYTLKVNDDLFNLLVWRGTANSQGFVSDPFALVQGRDKGAATVRLNVPVMDVANVKVQLEPKTSIVAHVTGEVYGAELGLIAQRKFLTDKDYTDNAVVVHAAYDFDIVKVTAGGGITMRAGGEDAPKLKDTFAFGAKVEAPITDEIKAEASYVLKQNDWKGNGSNSAIATVKGSYNTDELKVNANFTTTGKPVNTPTTADNRTTVIGVDGTYNFTDDINVKAGVKYTIEKDKLDLNAINTTNITASVAAPIIEDLLSAKASLGYTFDNYGAIQVGKYLGYPWNRGNDDLEDYSTMFALAKSLFSAEASVEVTPIEKLTLTPSVAFKSFKDGEAKVEDIRKLRDSDYADYNQDFVFTAGSIFTLKADASYAIGGGATLTLSAGNHTYNFTEMKHTTPSDTKYTAKYNNPFASAAVKVVF